MPFRPELVEGRLSAHPIDLYFYHPLTFTGQLTDAAPRIAVIGGGITGLAAAHRLHERLPHAQLALFEASPRLGGILETVHVDDFLIERSADNFLTKLPHGVDLCRRLGIESELFSTDDSRRRAFIVKGGKLMPIPSGFYLMSPRKLGPFLKSPILSLHGKIRALLEPFIQRGSASQFLNSEPPTLNPAADESVASFARRRFGREVFERLVQPLVAGMYTADPERLSMATTMRDFLKQEREQGSLLLAGLRASANDQASETASGARYNLFAAPKNGLTDLITTLAKRLPHGSINLNSPIAALRRAKDSGFELEFLPNPQSAVRNPESFHAVVVAAPAFAAAKLLEPIDAELAAELAAIEYAGCAIVSLGFKKDQIAHALDGFGIVVPQIENRPIIAASFASQKFPGRAPTDSVLIRVFIGGALQPQLLDRDDAALRRMAIEELRDLLQISGEPTLTDIARWPRSMPQYHVGHLNRVARIERLVARRPSLALAGNAYRGVGIPQCVASGESAAQRIVAYFA